MPATVGVSSRKENRAAACRSRLRNNPADMVIPLRETPGIKRQRLRDADQDRVGHAETWPRSFCLRPRFPPTT